MAEKVVSCVICAYNEAGRIGDVLKIVADHPLVKEVVVVDDGSADNTSEVARSFPRVKVVTQKENTGKSRALVHGVESAIGDTILLLDADLQHLTPENITALIEPVVSNAVDVSISVRGNSLAIYRAIGLDFISGERAFPRDLITDYVAEIQKLSRFGIESFMNQKIIEHKLRIAIVYLDNVINTRKAQKIGIWRGRLEELKMIMDIMHVLTPFEVARQNYRMLQLAGRLRSRRV